MLELNPKVNVLIAQVMDCCSRDSFAKVRSWVTGQYQLLFRYSAICTS
jgi:hypothetical protein